MHAFQALDPGIIAAVLKDNAFEAGDAILDEHLENLEPIFDPFDSAVVKVSAPMAFHREKYVAGLRFRLAHQVVAEKDDRGATFGQYFNDGEHNFYNPPLAGAVTEMTFYPPRRNARYVLEFWCPRQGDLAIRGSDGNIREFGADTPVSFVHYSEKASIRYTLSSAEYWTFMSCKLSWFPGQD
jgi:hypothetical protein